MWATLTWCQTTSQQGPPHTSHELEVYHYVLHSFCPVILINFGCLNVVCFLLFQLPLMLEVQNRCAVDVLNPVVIGQCSIVLNMNAKSLRFFTARMEIWLPLSRVFPLTNPLDLRIMSQIVAMFLSDRLARVHGESFLWSSTSIMATV